MLIEETISALATRILRENINEELANIVASVNKFYTKNGFTERAGEIIVPPAAFFEYTLEEKVTDELFRILLSVTREVTPGLKQTLVSSEFAIDVFIVYDYSYSEPNRYLIPGRIREAAIRVLTAGLTQYGFKDIYLTDIGQGDTRDNNNNRSTVTHFKLNLNG